MELSFVAPGTRTPRYALKLAGLPETVEPIDPAWIDDALTAALRVFEAHRVHFADAYFAYRARETSHETVGRSAAAGIGTLSVGVKLPSGVAQNRMEPPLGWR
ncbi:hypothetical protein ACQUWX_21845, partial [Ralstonia pseudosolanacearum]